MWQCATIYINSRYPLNAQLLTVEIAANISLLAIQLVFIQSRQNALHYGINKVTLARDNIVRTTLFQFHELSA